LARLDHGPEAVAGEQLVAFGDVVSLRTGIASSDGQSTAGPAGPAGSAGAAGRQGKPGKRGKHGLRGRPGRNADVSCRVRHRGRRHTVHCTVKHHHRHEAHRGPRSAG